MTLKSARFPFYVGISSLVVGIVLALSGLFLWVSHRESRMAAVHMADRLFGKRPAPGPFPHPPHSDAGVSAGASLPDPTQTSTSP